MNEKNSIDQLLYFRSPESNYKDISIMNGLEKCMDRKEIADTIGITVQALSEREKQLFKVGLLKFDKGIKITQKGVTYIRRFYQIFFEKYKPNKSDAKEKTASS